MCASLVFPSPLQKREARKTGLKSFISIPALRRNDGIFTKLAHLLKGALRELQGIEEYGKIVHDTLEISLNQ
jgi:hypothetical protein